MKKIGVIGIGNPLKRDDGIGVILLEKLIQRKNKFPKNVEFIDGGTGGMNLLHVLARLDVAIIIDAVNFGGVAGECKLFKPDEVVSGKYLKNISAHGFNFLKIVDISKNLGMSPSEIVIMGVQPKNISEGVRLSPELERKIEVLLKILEKNLQKYVSMS